MTELTMIHGAKKGSQSGSKPTETPDSLRSAAIARVLDVVSEGHIRGPANGLKSVFLDGTPIEAADGTLNFKNVQVEFRPGSQDQEHIAGFPEVESERGVGVELTYGTPWTHSLSNTQLDAVRVRLGVDSLSKLESDTGNILGHTIKYVIEVSTDGGAYDPVVQTSFTGKTTSPYERDHRIDLPPASSGWTIRVRRLTENANSSVIADTMRVVSVVEVIDAKLRYPNSALFGIAVDAEQFQSVPQRAFDLYGRDTIAIPSNYNPDTRVYTGIWDGTFKPGWTNNPAWVFMDLMLNKRYGLGGRVTQSQIDKWSLYRIAQYCDQMVSDGKGGTEPRFVCNVYLQSRKEAYSVLQDLTSIFRGMAYWSSNMVTCVADMPSDVSYIYTTANVVDGSFVYQGTSKKSRNTVALVSWNDPSDMCRAKVCYVEDEAGIQRYGVQTVELTSLGATSESQARRQGQWILTTGREETDTVTFSVGLDGVVAMPGMLIKVADPLRAGRRIGGRIAAATASSITVDSEPEAAPGDKALFMLPDGTVVTRVIQSIQGRAITFTQALTTIPSPESAWLVEPANQEAPTYRVVKVAQNEGLTYSITAVEHFEGKFDEIDDIPVIVQPPAPGSNDAQQPPSNLIISHREVAGEVVAMTIVNADWDAAPNAVSYKVEYRLNSGSWQSAGSTSATSFDISGVTSGTIDVRVVAVNGIGQESRGLVVLGYVIPDQTTVPGVIDDLIRDLAAEAAAREAADRAEMDARIDEIRDVSDQVLAEAQARADQIAQETADRIAADLQVANDASTAADAKIANAKSEMQAQIDVVKGQVADIYGADTWSSALAYVAGDLVQYGTGPAQLYRAKQPVPVGTPLTNTLYWELLGNYASLGEAVSANLQLSTTTANEVAAHSQTLTDHSARFDNVEASVTSMQQAYADADTALAQDITALEGVVNDPVTGLAATAAAVSMLDTEVTDLSGVVTSQSGSITQLQSKVGDGILGDEMISNSAFDQSTTPGWTFIGVTPSVSNGQLRLVSNGTTNTRMERAFTGLTVGAKYRLTLRAKRGATGTDAGQQIRNPIGFTQTPTMPKIVSTTYSDLVVEFTATAANGTIRIYLTGSTAEASEIFIDSASFRPLSTLAVADVLNTTTTKITQQGELLDSTVVDVKSLKTVVEDPVTGVAATASGLSSMNTRVSNAEGVNTTQANQISSLQADVAGKASASALTDLTARVTDTESAIDSQSASVTTLSNEIYAARSGSEDLGARLDGIDTTVASKASSSALSALDSRVGVTPAGYSSFASKITALDTAVAGKASSSALSALDSRVTSTEGVNSSQASQITSLQSDVAGKASASAVQTLTTRVDSVEQNALNVNMLANSSFAASLDGWTVFNQPSWQACERDLSGDAWHPPGIHNAGFYSPSGTGAYAWLEQIVPVVPGDRHIVSSYMAAHRCRIYIETTYLDANKTAISGQLVNSQLYDAGSGYSIGGNASLTSWWRGHAVLGVAPSNARFVRVRLITNTNGNSSAYGWFIRPMLERSREGQSAPSAYNTGGSEVMAAYTMQLTASGKVAGIYAMVNGQRSDLIFDFDQVSFTNADGSSTISSGSIVNKKGGYMSALGAGFGANGDLVQWYGPSMATSACTKANAIMYADNNGNATFSGVVEGGLLRASALELGSTRIHTGGGRLAPFTVREFGYKGQATGQTNFSATVTLPAFVSPSYGSGYHHLRLSRGRSDIILSCTLHGDGSGGEDVYLDVQYDGGAWNNFVSRTGINVDYRGGFTILARATTFDSWSTVAFRARTTRGNTICLALSALVDNTYETGNAAGSVSGMDSSSGTGGTPPSGGGSGGGGTYCVDWETTVLPDGRFVRDLQVGDLVETVNVRTGERSMQPLLAIGVGYEECYLVQTENAEIIQSKSTPMDMRDGSVVRTPDLEGLDLLSRECGWEPAKVRSIGVRKVCKPDLGDRMFFAGMSVDRTLATHNVRYKDPLDP